MKTALTLLVFILTAIVGALDVTVAASVGVLEVTKDARPTVSTMPVAAFVDAHDVSKDAIAMAPPEAPLVKVELNDHYTTAMGRVSVVDFIVLAIVFLEEYRVIVNIYLEKPYYRYGHVI
jgi:hypothetical protein